MPGQFGLYLLPIETFPQRKKQSKQNDFFEDDFTIYVKSYSNYRKSYQKIHKLRGCCFFCHKQSYFNEHIEKITTAQMMKKNAGLRDK
ncbi:hypothetical protein BAU14_08275 [Enterococcus sp. CU9D]|nr:hypothetical protein BAU14_08275 [Enterococcus sp. CU9D]